VKKVTLQDLPDEQFFCLRGASGHAWDEVSKPARAGRWGFRTHLRCTRCGKEKEVIHNSTGYDPVIMYATPRWHLKVTEPYDTADVRTEALNRRLKGRKVQRRLRAV
jgi:hypothetical protein